MTEDAAAAVFLLLLFTASTLFPATSAQPPAAGCVDELVAFSPCLSYVSAPPNNVTRTAASQCCDAVSSVIASGDGTCLCYLIRQPLIFSFPLNQTRVSSLPRVCNMSRSLESICSTASPELPPLRNTTGSDLSKPGGNTTGLDHSRPEGEKTTGSGLSKPEGRHATGSEISKPSNSATGHHHSARPENVRAPSISFPAHPARKSPARPENVRAPSISSPAHPARKSPATSSFLPGNSVRSPTTPSSSSVPGNSSPAQPARNSPAASSFLPGNSVRSPTTPSSSVQLVRGSFSTTRIFNCSWLLPGMLIFPLVFIHA